MTRLALRASVSHRAFAFWQTVIGKKVVMAVTGVVLVGFVIAHMVGNLKMFSGPDEINAYSRFLREVGTPELAYGQLLWVVRIVLLLCVALHVTAALQLSRMSWSARPVGYRAKRTVPGLIERRRALGGQRRGTRRAHANRRLSARYIDEGAERTVGTLRFAHPTAALPSPPLTACTTP